MQSDFEVELGRDDPVLEIPWRSEDGAIYFVDLKSAPHRICEISEVIASPELKSILLRLNGPSTPFFTAKCDAWLSTEFSAEEDIFNAECKYVSYIDLIFTCYKTRSSFVRHEQYAEQVCVRLKEAPEYLASAELIIRRCYFDRQPRSHPQNQDLPESLMCSPLPEPHSTSTSVTQQGFYLTLYVTGYGATSLQARSQWASALHSVEEALCGAG